MLSGIEGGRGPEPSAAEVLEEYCRRARRGLGERPLAEEARADEIAGEIAASFLVQREILVPGLHLVEEGEEAPGEEPFELLTRTGVRTLAWALPACLCLVPYQALVGSKIASHLPGAMCRLALWLEERGLMPGEAFAFYRSREPAARADYRRLHRLMLGLEAETPGLAGEVAAGDVIGRFLVRRVKAARLALDVPPEAEHYDAAIPEALAGFFSPGDAVSLLLCRGVFGWRVRASALPARGAALEGLVAACAPPRARYIRPLGAEDP